MNKRQFLASFGAFAVVGSTANLALANSKTMQVYRSPSCGCCSGWARHIQRSGINVALHNVDDLTPYKQRGGVPEALQSCHTAFIGGYAIEGHVPVREVKRLLVQRPNAKGLAVPGMPVGTPGMEMGGRRDPFQVVIYGAGWTKPYASYGAVRLKRTGHQNRGTRELRPQVDATRQGRWSG